MRGHFICHNHALPALLRGALSKRPTGIGPSARCTSFEAQISHTSTFTLESRERRTTHPGSPYVAPQESIPNPFTGAGVPALLKKEVLDRARTIVQSSTVPDPGAVEETLQACERFARILAGEVPLVGQGSRAENTQASNLLSLEETQDNSKSQFRRDSLSRKDAPLTGDTKSAAAQLVSSTAYKVITEPKVYITPKLLSLYVNVQSLLGRPQSLPEVLSLYASKPVPKSNTAPIQYKTPYPRKPSAHIPLEIANNALTAAIKIRNLPLCFDIIHYSVCAPAFRISKFFRKAFIPLSGAVLAPLAIYKLSSELAAYQTMWDTPSATQMLFAGILAYVSFTSIIGVVAITTANDHMDRVTWAIGTPLRERWMREEERMLIDRVAGAWGFQQRSRRGNEEGPDWEALREWIGMRGMVLDKTELMDGME